MPTLARLESPRYPCRAVAALASDPQAMRFSGQVLRVADLTERNDFNEINNRCDPALAPEPGA